MSAKFELKKSKNGQFCFNLKAANGQVVLTGETYPVKSSAQNGIASVRKNCKQDARYDRKTASNGKPYFVLKAANGETLGKSQMYSSTKSMEKGIASVRANGSAAKVDDQS